MPTIDQSHIPKIRCATCRQPITAEQNAVACSICGISQHGGCWHQHGGCATRGCGGRPLVYLPGAQAAAAPVSQRLVLQPQEPAAATMTPVWAPNPGVPVIARILAYAFAFLMLLIWALSITQDRPPDLAPNPVQWAMYRGPQGLMLPYPAGWYTVEDPADPNQSVLFVLRHGGPVQVNVVPLSLSADTWPQISSEKMNSTVERQWVEQGFAGENFLPTDGAFGPLEDIHAFTFTIPGKQKDLAMSGAWTMRTNGKRMVILLSSSPQEGWMTMKNIFTYIASNIQF